MKEDLRKKMTACRNALSKIEAEDFSQRISASVFHWILEDVGLKDFAQSLVLGYMAIRNEADVSTLLIRMQSLGATIALPRVLDKEHMEFFEVDFQKAFDDFRNHADANKGESGHYFEISRFGILEPRLSCPRVDFTLYKKVYLLMPCLGLNRSNHRLGYGAGYYDRYFDRAFLENLQQSKVVLTKIAPVYPFQRDLDFAGDEHDLRADIVRSCETEEDFRFFVL